MTQTVDRHPSVDWRSLWQAYAENYGVRVEAMAPADEGAARREILFCLLGGHGVSYELALSATERCAELDVFAPTWRTEELTAALTDELSKPQFLPTRVDGSLRRYRYPTRKAKLIGAAAVWLDGHTDFVGTILKINPERDRRDFLCNCPGIGLKTASWLLRNLGLAQNLAVLDVHVLRAMTSAGVLGAASLPRDYEIVETSYLEWCAEIEAPPAAFDLFLWEFQRGTMSVIA